MGYTLKLLGCLMIVLAVGSFLPYANPLEPRFQAIIFDCDGILVDTEYLKFLAWKEALGSEKIPFLIEEYIPLVGYDSKNILQMIKDAKNIEISKEIIALKNQKYRQLQKKGVTPIEKMVNFALWLAKYKEQSGLLLAVASSAPKEEILFNLKQVGLENAFDLIVSGADDLKKYIDPEGTNKPKPYIYLESAKQLGISAERCLVFEDSKAGVDAAAAAGTVAIAVPNEFTRSHDFSNAYRIISSYEELVSFDILTKPNGKQ